MNAHGIVHRYGDNVDTDVIIPARYLNTASHAELASHCMEDIDKDFAANVKPGDIIVGGRELRLRLFQRARADRHQGQPAFPASSPSTFARIFFRNSINIGLPILECDAAAQEIQAGDEVEVDFDTGVITDVTTGKTYKAQPFPPFIQNIIQKGGLLKSITEK